MALLTPPEPVRVDGLPSGEVDPRLAAGFVTAGKLCAVSVAAIGVVVLTGWFVGSTALERVGLDHQTMKVNTALGLLAAAVCLTALMTSGARARRVASVTGLLVLIIGAAHLSEYLLGVNLGIDQALYRDAPGVMDPGRMAPNTAVAFMLFGCAAVLYRRQVGRVWPSNPLAVGVLAIGLVAVIGHLVGATSLFGVGSATQMSVPAALACALLGAGLLLISPTRGAMRLLVSHGPGGALARWLLPVAITIPPLFGLLSQEGQTLGLYGSQVGSPPDDLVDGGCGGDACVDAGARARPQSRRASARDGRAAEERGALPRHLRERHGGHGVGGRGGPGRRRQPRAVRHARLLRARTDGDGVHRFHSPR